MVNNKSNLKNMLYVCKSFLAHGVVSTIKLILHKIFIFTKCLLEIMTITLIHWKTIG